MTSLGVFIVELTLSSAAVNMIVRLMLVAGRTIRRKPIIGAVAIVKQPINGLTNTAFSGLATAVDAPKRLKSTLNYHFAVRVRLYESIKCLSAFDKSIKKI